MLLLMCGAGFVLVALASIATPFKVILVTVFLLPGTLFFLLASAYYAIALRPDRPVLILDRDGLTEQSSLIGVGFVPWSDLRAVKITEYCNQAFLCVEGVHSAQFIAARRNPFWRWAKRFNLKRGLGIVTISAPLLGVPASEIAEVITTRIAQARSGGV